ncbi:MAG: hypothetical protein ACE5HQ_06495 [Gemmatimonadota bacterium]
MGAGDALRSDNGNPYLEGTDGGVHLNGATGRLMLWTSQYDVPTRVVQVTTSAFSGPTSDRIYTNGHEPVTSGCGFKDIAAGGSGTAVLEVELDADGIVRYGKACNGDADASTRVAVTRSSDGLTWTVEGTSGRHCQKLGKKRNIPLTEVGTAGPFFMTLEQI